MLLFFIQICLVLLNAENQAEERSEESREIMLNSKSSFLNPHSAIHKPCSSIIIMNCKLSGLKQILSG